jgi:deoxyribodipyrimidine photolyase-related protein
VGRRSPAPAHGGPLTKPYAGGGNYVNRMSRFCGECRYDPRRRTGPDACPLTAFYWEFIDRHGERFAGNPRMRMPLRTLARMDDGELDGIRRRAREAHEEAAGWA